MAYSTFLPFYSSFTPPFHSSIEQQPPLPFSQPQPPPPYSLSTFYWPRSKMTISIFDGTNEDAYGWVLCTEKHFKLTGTPGESKVAEAVAALHGCALQWWLSWSHHHPAVSWNTFTTALLWRFKPEWQSILPILDEEEPESESLYLVEAPSLTDVLVADSVSEVVNEWKVLTPTPVSREPSPPHAEIIGDGSHYPSLSLTQSASAVDRSEISFSGTQIDPFTDSVSGTTQMAKRCSKGGGFKSADNFVFHHSGPVLHPCDNEFPNQAPSPPPKPPDRGLITSPLFDSISGDELKDSPPFVQLQFSATSLQPSTPSHIRVPPVPLCGDPQWLSVSQSRSLNDLPYCVPASQNTTLHMGQAVSGDAFFNSHAFPAVSHMAPCSRYKPLDLQQIFQASSQPLLESRICVLPVSSNLRPTRVPLYTPNAFLRITATTVLLQKWKSTHFPYFDSAVCHCISALVQWKRSTLVATNWSYWKTFYNLEDKVGPHGVDSDTIHTVWVACLLPRIVDDERIWCRPVLQMTSIVYCFCYNFGLHYSWAPLWLTLGITSALEPFTFGVQAYGADWLSKFGNYTCCAIAALFAACSQISPVLTITDKLLLLFTQDLGISYVACEYCISKKFGFTFIRAMIHYFLNQRLGYVGATLTTEVSYWLTVVWVRIDNCTSFAWINCGSNVFNWIFLLLASSMNCIVHKIPLNTWNFSIYDAATGLVPMVDCDTTFGKHSLLFGRLEATVKLKDWILGSDELVLKTNCCGRIISYVNTGLILREQKQRMLVFPVRIKTGQQWDPGGQLDMSVAAMSSQFKQWDPGKFIQGYNFYNLEDKVDLDGVGIVMIVKP